MKTEGDPITLPDGTEGIIAYIPESEVWRRPAREEVMVTCADAGALRELDRQIAFNQAMEEMG